MAAICFFDGWLDINVLKLVGWYFFRLCSWLLSVYRRHFGYPYLVALPSVAFDKVLWRVFKTFRVRFRTLSFLNLMQSFPIQPLWRWWPPQYDGLRWLRMLSQDFHSLSDYFFFWIPLFKDDSELVLTFVVYIYPSIKCTYYLTFSSFCFPRRVIWFTSITFVKYLSL